MLPPTDLQSFTVSHIVPLLPYERCYAHPKLNAKSFKIHITIVNELWPGGDKLSRPGRVPAAPVLLLIVTSCSHNVVIQLLPDTDLVKLWFLHYLSTDFVQTQVIWKAVIYSQTAFKVEPNNKCENKQLTDWSQISTNFHIGDYNLLFMNL